MMNVPAGPKTRGVTLPQHQQQDTDAPGAPRTVTGMATLEHYCVNYVDEAGVRRNTVLVVVGGEAYIPKNAEEWLKTLLPAAPWFKAQAMQRIEARKKRLEEKTDDNDLPDDSVSVTGTKP